MMILAQIALPSKAADSFVIVGVLLAILGTLFLAYDLLGRENGPLRWFTLVIICGLVSALLLATIGTIADVTVDKLFNNPINLNFTVPFLALGGSMGFFTVILVELPASKSKPPIFSRKGSLIGLAFGLTFAFVIKFILRGPTEATLVLGGSCAVFIGVWQRITWEPSQAASNRRGVWQFVAWEEPSLSNPNPRGTWKFVDWEPPHPRLHLFSRKGFWTGLVAGFVPWLIFLILENNATSQGVSGPVQGFEALLNFSVILLFAGALALATAVAGSIAQYTLWRANRLPHRILGAFGLFLIVVAFGLQGVQPMIDLFNNVK